MSAAAKLRQELQGHRQPGPPREFESGEYPRVVRLSADEARRLLGEMGGENGGTGGERLHALEDAPGEQASKPRATAIPRGAKALSASRLATRAQDALDLREAIEIAGASISGVALHLRVHESVVRSWCDAAVVASPASGDVDALPGKVRSAYYAIKRARGAAGPAKSMEALSLDMMAGALTLALAAKSGDVDAITKAAAALDDVTLALARSARSGR